ncbi:MAG: hypothetical protein GY864_01895 [Desulfobacterales bacterium]|nr:hypothetical protein [Desulfobacterales bacterium]
MSDSNNTTDKILGIDREIIEKFLFMMKVKYPLVDYANYFLESRTGASGVNIAMANQRDFISHFCTILNNHSLTLQEC